MHTVKCMKNAHVHSSVKFDICGHLDDYIPEQGGSVCSALDASHKSFPVSRRSPCTLVLPTHRKVNTVLASFNMWLFMSGFFRSK